MRNGVKAGFLLGLTLGCSTRSLVLDLRGDGGHGGGGVPIGGRSGMGGGGGEHHAECVPGDEGPMGRSPPVAFDGWRTTGALRLVPGRTFMIGGAARAIAMADLDADGRPDLVVAGEAIVNVLVNAGDGTFAPRAGVSINAGSTSLAIGDVNNDGRPDIVVGGDGGAGVELLVNVGEAHFRNVALCLCGGLQPSVALGDLDGDGSQDVLVANRMAEDSTTSGDLVVLLNDDASPFKHEPAHYAAGAAPRSVAVGDVNGDGRPDVVVAGICSVSVLLNAGDGRLADPVRYDAVTGTIALADVDGDGDLDIVDTSHGGWSADVLLNGGDGVFAPAVGNPVANPTQAAIGDMDGDGLVDLVVAQEGVGYGLGVLFNGGGGRFGTLLEYAPDGSFRGVAVGDLDGDGRLDVVAAGEGGVTLFFNRPPSP